MFSRTDKAPELVKGVLFSRSTNFYLNVASPPAHKPVSTLYQAQLFYFYLGRAYTTVSESSPPVLLLFRCLCSPRQNLRSFSLRSSLSPCPSYNVQTTMRLSGALTLIGVAMVGSAGTAGATMSRGLGGHRGRGDRKKVGPGELYFRVMVPAGETKTVRQNPNPPNNRQ